MEYPKEIPPIIIYKHLSILSILIILIILLILILIYL